MANTQTIINNVSCSWSQIRLTIPSIAGSTNDNPTILNGVSAIKWNSAQKTEKNYGLGGKAIGRGFGNIVDTASITLDHNTQMTLRALAGGGSLRNLGEFDVIISWVNDFSIDNYEEETVTLKGCFFNEDGMDAAQDSTSITKEFDLNPFEIVTQNVSA